MKSIRLSLMVYFLLLLAVALGAVSLLVYEISAEFLRQKQETYRELLKVSSEDRRREETDKLNNGLLSHATNLVQNAKNQGYGNRVFQLMLQPLFLMSASQGSQSQFLAPLWCSNDFIRALASDIQLNEELLRSSDDRSDFFQINRPRGGEWRSHSLGERSLPLDKDQFRQMEMLEWRFEDIDWNGMKLRRILYKAPILHSSFYPGVRLGPRTGTRPRRDQRPPTPAPNTNQGSAPAPPAAQRSSELPHFYIQYATDRKDYDDKIAEITRETATKLQESDEKSQQSLAGLSRRLWWISGATFCGVCVGAFLLVSMGLSPLRRLSDAVSRVSETNFNLEIDGPQPPVELMPIVDRLRGSLAMLQKAFDREKQATADISHELRTPLAGLMTTVEVALRKPRTTEEYRESLQDCRDIIRQMSQMVERLLTLTWLDARSDRISSEPVDIGSLADQCAAVIRPLAKARGLTLNVHTDAKTLVRADRDKLREVMANLLHNAVEYNRPNGTIDLRVESSASGLDLEVRDTGIGISPENRDRIFERFFRADESRQATGLHAGLGLAIVRGYVDLMGGTISVESELGRGSAFHVHIPAPKA